MNSSEKTLEYLSRGFHELNSVAQVTLGLAVICVAALAMWYIYHAPIWKQLGELAEDPFLKQLERHRAFRALPVIHPTAEMVEWLDFVAAGYAPFHECRTLIVGAIGSQQISMCFLPVEPEAADEYRNFTCSPRMFLDLAEAKLITAGWTVNHEEWKLSAIPPLKLRVYALAEAMQRLRRQSN